MCIRDRNETHRSNTRNNYAWYVGVFYTLGAADQPFNGVWCIFLLLNKKLNTNILLFVCLCVCARAQLCIAVVYFSYRLSLSPCILVSSLTHVSAKSANIMPQGSVWLPSFITSTNQRKPTFPCENFYLHFWWRIFMFWCISVSYTHLDVYKRQG